MSSADLLIKDSETFRVYINSDGQLVFQVLNSDDAGFYSYVLISFQWIHKV